MNTRKQTRWPDSDTAPKATSQGMRLEARQITTINALADEYRVSAGAIIRQAIRCGLPTVCRMLASAQRRGKLRGGGRGGGSDGV